MSLNIKRLVVLLTLLCCGLSNRASAEDTNVELSKVREGNFIYLIVKLNNCSEATITITATMENMVASVPLPLTVDIIDQKRAVLAAFRAVDPTQPFNCTGRYNWKYGRHSGVNLRPYAYSLPYKTGPFEVIQGPHGRFSHNLGSQEEEAVDWAMPVGTTVYAARPGTVIALRSDCDEGAPDRKRREDCNLVILRHDDGTFGAYLHLKKDGVLVHLGERVALHQPIALSGNSGYTTEPHLHFGVFYPLDGYTRKSIPIEFVARNGEIFKPMEGKVY